MPKVTPLALARRVALLTVLTGILIGATISTQLSGAQTPSEGKIRLIPAMSNVPGDGGPFTVYIVAEDVQHDGAITYDDDRDGTPDRSVPSQGLAAFQVTIDYNPAILSVGGVESGPELGRSGRTFQCLPPDQKPGKLTFGCLSFGNSPPGTEGTLTLASVKLLPTGEGLSPLALSAELAGPLGDGMGVTVDGGAARVTGAVVPGPTTQGGNTPVGGTETSPPSASDATATSETRATEIAGAQNTGTPAQSTPAATPGTGTPRPGSTPGPGDQNSGSSFGGATLWSVIVAGTIGAGGLLTLAGMVWRQRQHRGRI